LLAGAVFAKLLKLTFSGTVEHMVCSSIDFTCLPPKKPHFLPHLPRSFYGGWSARNSDAGHWRYYIQITLAAIR
jgi:hypothetical protein